MSHRETSIHSWLGPADPAVPISTWDEATGRWSDDDPKTDEEKHLFCRRRTGVCATFIPQTMYDQATALHCDMRGFVPNRPMPLGPVPDSMTRRGNPVRKSHNRNGSACHGKDVPCMPGLNGKCVACFDDD